MTTARTWDLTGYFPSFEGPERAEFEAALAKDADALLEQTSGLAAIGAADDLAWERCLLGYEGVLGRFSHLSSYITCLASAHSDDERYVIAEGKLGLLRATVDKLSVELRRALGGAEDAAFTAFCGRPELDGAQFFLRQLRVEAKTSMPVALEALAADLGNHGIVGWGRLYDTLSGQLTFTMPGKDGSSEVLPMAQRRSLMADADREVRRSAFIAGNEAWHGVREIAAAALNHIAGSRHLLNERRHVGHFLDVARHQSAVSARSLDAMFEAVRAGRALPQRGLRLKARAMGLERIDWFDLEAPLPFGDQSRIGFEEAVAIVRRSFSRGYPRLAGYFEKLLSERGIESEKRGHKRPGAYCTSSDHNNLVRVFMTYAGSLGDVSTLAHEVGHAFQAEVMRDCRVLARQLPMTLAETASTFAECLLADGMLSEPGLSPQQRALLLGEQIGDGAAFLLDVPTRFAFEKRFYEERLDGELSATRLSTLMSETQRELFGDALGETDPLFWASKLHFFIPDVTFYNFPYTFGFLLSRGMYAKFLQEGEAFLPRYEAFLGEAGKGMAHEVAARTVGCDLENAAFWNDALQSLKAPTDELERLLPQLEAS